VRVFRPWAFSVAPRPHAAPRHPADTCDKLPILPGPAPTVTEPRSWSRQRSPMPRRSEARGPQQLRPPERDPRLSVLGGTIENRWHRPSAWAAPRLGFGGNDLRGPMHSAGPGPTRVAIGAPARVESQDAPRGSVGSDLWTHPAPAAASQAPGELRPDGMQGTIRCRPQVSPAPQCVNGCDPPDRPSIRLPDQCATKCATKLAARTEHAMLAPYVSVSRADGAAGPSSREGSDRPESAQHARTPLPRF
jgi:hypothetical protein